MNRYEIIIDDHDKISWEFIANHIAKQNEGLILYSMRGNWQRLDCAFILTGDTFMILLRVPGSCEVCDKLEGLESNYYGNSLSLKQRMLQDIIDNDIDVYYTNTIDEIKKILLNHYCSNHLSASFLIERLQNKMNKSADMIMEYRWNRRKFAVIPCCFFPDYSGYRNE